MTLFLRSDPTACVIRKWFQLTFTGTTWQCLALGFEPHGGLLTAQTTGSFVSLPQSWGPGCPGLCSSNHSSRCPTFRATGLGHGPLLVCSSRRLETTGCQSWSVCSAAPREPGSFLSCEPPASPGGFSCRPSCVPGRVPHSCSLVTFTGKKRGKKKEKSP